MSATTTRSKANRQGVSVNGARTMAQEADRYRLYLDSVQSPDHEVWFFQRVYKTEYDRLPVVLREDFCGTAAICYEWVKKPGRRAIGVDIDPEPLQWGREHLASTMRAEQIERVTLLQRDVRDVTGEKADVLAAQNFSFWIFKTREEVRRYFEAARRNLADEGVMVVDMMGGSESMQEDRRDVTPKGKFKYVWEQARFCPITHDCTFYIHFHFKDGSKLKRAFTYHWRFWTIPEVKELLLEAGFSRVDVYWEDTDPETGEGNDVYRRRKHAEADAAWISYLVAVK